MVEILRMEGYNIRHTGEMFHSPFREDKNKSLHINDKKHIWFDHGDTNESHMKVGKNGKKYVGGDTFDFVKILKGYRYREEAMDYLASITPGFVKSSPVTDPDKMASRRKGPLSGYEHHASDANTVWTGILMDAGAENILHLSGNKKDGTPYISEDDYLEAAEHIRKANEKLERQPDSYLHTLSRYWIQVREADSLFVIGRLSGDVHKSVDGVFAWPVQMAIDEKKPVYLYEQDRKRFFQYLHDAEAWEEMSGTPVFTNSFATAGHKKNSSEYDTIVKQIIDETIRQRHAEIGTSKNQRQSTEPQKDPSIFSDYAVRPFTYGLSRFDSVARFMAWSKAVFFDQNEKAAQILNCDDIKDVVDISDSISGPGNDTWLSHYDELREVAIRLSFLSNPELLASAIADENKAAFDARAKDQPLRSVMTEFLSNIDGVSNDYKGEAHYVVKKVARWDKWSPTPERSIAETAIVDKLHDYMTKERTIGVKQLSHYCAILNVQIEYRTESTTSEGSTILAVGFPNKDHGFELRKESYTNEAGEKVSGMKKCTSKAISVIGSKGEFLCDPLRQTSDKVLVFEGFVDFLAYLCWNNNVVEPGCDCVILNSTSMAHSAIPFISKHKEAICYLDNDESGKKCYRNLETECALAASAEGRQITIMDGSYAYAKNKDLSEAYTAYVKHGRKAVEVQKEETVEAEPSNQNEIDL